MDDEDTQSQQQYVQAMQFAEAYNQVRLELGLPPSEWA